MLPVVATEILALSHRPDASIDDLVRLLERDPTIAGRVFRRIHSPLHATTTPARSLREAILRLGLRSVGELVMEVVLGMKVFRAPRYAEPMDRVRRHSIAVASLARVVSRYTPMPSEYSFLTGLLHDVGVAGILIALSSSDLAAGVPEAELWSAVADAHEHAASVLGTVWKLPGEVTQVIGHHHSVKQDGIPHPLAAVVAIADVLAERMSPTLQPFGARFDATTPAVLAEAVATLGLQPRQLQLIDRDGRAALEKLK